MQKLVPLLLLTVFVCCGCAVLNPENRHTFNIVKSNLVPRHQDPTFWQYCLLVPAGLAAVALDTVVVHPLMVLDDAWQDTENVLWARFEWQDHYVTECGTLPFRVAATPFVYLPVWLMRSAFDINGPEEEAPPG